MAKNNSKQIENLYKLSNNNVNSKKNSKQIEKRIKQKRREKKDQFDLDTETVIGMTNKNNQRQNQEEKIKISKKQAKILKKQKKRKRILKILSLLILVIAGIVFALVSPIFNIKEITVKNNSQIPEETIISLSKLQEGENIFKLNKNHIKKEIKTNPYIKNVTIERKIPNKVVINIEERVRTFNIENLNGYAYINNQGYILEIAEEKADLPVIKGTSTAQEQIVERNRLNDQDLEKLETVIQIINICKDYEIDTKITSIDISDKNNYIVYMEGEKKTIYLGDSSNLSNKMLYVPAILQENLEKEGTIYVNGDINNNFKPRFRESL